MDEEEQKVLACYGHVNYKSIARMTGINYKKVAYILSRNGKRKVCKSYSINNLVEL